MARDTSTTNNTNGHGDEPWTVARLFEHAGLAGLGLLDRDEHEAYEHALREQSPEVRAQVMREQERFAESGELFAHVEPDASLRDRVLDAVQAAMVDRVMRAQALEAQPRRNGWRIASAGLLAACVAIGAVAFQTYRTNSTMRQQIESNQFALGTVLVDDMMFGATSRRVVFAPGEGSESVAQAALFINEAQGTARLLYRGLSREEGAMYSVVELNESGEISRELGRFAGASVLDAASVAVPASNARLAIVRTQDGIVPSGRVKALLTAKA